MPVVTQEPEPEPVAQPEPEPDPQPQPKPRTACLAAALDQNGAVIEDTTSRASTFWSKQGATRTYRIFGEDVTEHGVAMMRGDCILTLSSSCAWTGVATPDYGTGAHKAILSLILPERAQSSASGYPYHEFQYMLYAKTPNGVFQTPAGAVSV